MKTLVLNSGSSSIKCQYFINQKSVAFVVIEEIAKTNSTSTIKYNQHTIQNNSFIANHEEALDMIFTLLLESELLVDINQVDAIGHRIVHGGSKFSEPLLIETQSLKELEEISYLAPLHNPHNLKAIKIFRDKYPTIPQVAVFDTAFHQSIPDYASLYALPSEVSEKFAIKRYGFHGTSHAYVAKKSAEILQKELSQLNLITLHLGNGASATAIRAGKSIDTSMGFTPLDGLIMGTRAGDIDGAIVSFLMKNNNQSIEKIDTMLNKESGLLGICGSSDMREITKQAQVGDTQSQLALDMYSYRIKKYIGAYTIALGRVDAIVFTAGVGEHSAIIREMVCQGLDESIGAKIDTEKNNTLQGYAIHNKSSKIAILVVPTNEELEIAMQTQKILEES